MIYLASPYTHKDPQVQQQRYELAMEAVAEFLRQGEFVYSPIVHCHEMAKRHSLPTDYQFWWNYNVDFMDSAQSIYVLCIDGWKESAGVRKEIEFAIADMYRLRFYSFVAGALIELPMTETMKLMVELKGNKAGK